MNIRMIDARPGEEFRLTVKPTVCARSTFTAFDGSEAICTRRLNDILGLPDATPVIAHWHGEQRTDAFLVTVGILKRKAAAWPAIV